jgi:hypothetical protein
VGDITLCDGHGCPATEQCHRFSPYVPSEKPLMYFAGVPYNHTVQKCHMFYEKPKEAA